MEFVRLEPEQRRSFEEDGFLVVRNALSEAQVAEIREAGDRIAGSFLTKPPIDDKPAYNYLDQRPGLLREPALFALVTHAPTVSLIAQLLGPNIHLHSTALIYKRPSPQAPLSRFGWHRDIRIPRDLGHEALPRVGVKVCYCLTDFHEPRSGMTLLARGSHKRTAPLSVKQGEVDPSDLEVCDLRLNAGDAFLFENRLFHTAAPNLGDRCSRVVLYGYSYRWMKTETYLEVPDERQLAATDPLTRQLMGGYRDIDTPPWGLQRWAKRHGVLPENVPWTVEA
jgi:ectoine hydroxylase-related dioxygenase (phytanoyl-CoA dioxygenase family)